MVPMCDGDYSSKMLQYINIRGEGQSVQQDKIVVYI